MYAFVGHFQGEPGSIKKIARNVEEIAAPSLKGLKGYKNLIILGDPKTDKGISITLWESEADCLEWVNGEGRKKSGSQMVAAGTPQVTWEGYEVTFQD